MRTPASMASELTSPGLLGLAAVRVWMLCNMGGTFVQGGDGALALAASCVYGLVALTGGLFALRKTFAEETHSRIAWCAFAAMMASTALTLVGTGLQATALATAGGLLAGAAGAVSDCVWAHAFSRVELRQGVFYGFLSLSLGSLIGLFLGLLPREAALIASMVMPALSILAFQRAQRTLAAPRHAPVYDGEPRSTVVIVLCGIALFGLALGISHGIPAEQSASEDPLVSALCQVGAAMISIFVIWWAIIKGRRLSFSLLWRIEILLIATGLLMLSVLPGRLTGVACAFIGIADTFMLGVIWVTLQDAVRHSTLNAYGVYGIAFAARVLARNMGRAFIMGLGATSHATYTITAAVGGIVFALAVGMALLLSDNVPRRRPLLGSLAESPCETEAGQSSPLPASGSTPLMRADDLVSRLGLSKREAEIAVLIAQGRSKPYIAQHLYVTEGTVRTHAKNIYAKLNIHSKQDLIDLVEEAS